MTRNRRAALAYAAFGVLCALSMIWGGAFWIEERPLSGAYGSAAVITGYLFFAYAGIGSVARAISLWGRGA